MAILDFTAWSELSVRLSERDANTQKRLLADAGLSEQEWQALDKHHTQALVQDLTRGELTRATLRAKHFAEEQQRRQQDPPGEASPSSAPPASEPHLGTEDISHLRLRKALPFAQPEAGSAPLRLVPAPPRPASAEQGATVCLSDLRQPAPVLPFHADRPGPTLPLERYAAFTADLEAHPHDEAAVLGRHGLKDQEARASVEAAYAQQFSEDPDLQRHFRQLVGQFRGWL